MCSDSGCILTKESLGFGGILFVGFKRSRRVKDNSKLSGLGKQKNLQCSAKEHALCSQHARV